MVGELATEQELGAEWHFGGRRCWDWLHDGRRPNGWVVLGLNGVLLTSFPPAVNDHPSASWWRRGDGGSLMICFLNCIHLCRLREGAAVPTFDVSERFLRTGGFIPYGVGPRDVQARSRRTEGRLCDSLQQQTDPDEGAGRDGREEKRRRTPAR